MAKKKTTTTSPTTKSATKVTRQSAASAHEQEFAEVIMGPKFWSLLVDHDFDLTYTTLTTVYNTANGTRLSTSSIKKYLDLLGWKYERKPQWTGLPQLEDESPSTMGPAEILKGPFDDEVEVAEKADPNQQGHTIGGPLPGQGGLSSDERSLLG